MAVLWQECVIFRLTESCHVGFERWKGHVGLYLCPSSILVIIFVSVCGVLPWANYPSTSARGHIMVWRSNTGKISENKTMFGKMRDELNRVVSKSASIANAYGLDGGIRIPLGGENFCTRPDQTWGSFSFPIKCLPFFWRGGGIWRWPSNPYQHRGYRRERNVPLHPPVYRFMPAIYMKSNKEKTCNYNI